VARGARLALALLALVAITEAGAQPAVPSDSPAAPTAATLPALRAARDRLSAARDFEAARNPAQAAVAAQAQQRDADYADDLTALGGILTELRDLDAAEARYQEALNVIESTEGNFSPNLIDAFRGLGRTYIRGARYVEAIAALEQAQDLSRRNLGLFNTEQSNLLDDITTAYLGLGDTVEARRRQLDRLDNAVRRFGATDPRVIPYRYTLANYYERSRLPASAREQYEAVLQLQEAELGSTHPALLGPLRELMQLDLLVAQGADAAQRDRLATLLEQNPTADSIERGLSLALLGDWAIVTGDPLAARNYYQQAWTALAASPDVNAAEYFATPAMLDFVAPLSPVDRATRNRPHAWAEIALEFAVSAEGRPADVRVVGDLPGPLPASYRRRLRETHFRPRLVAGEPVTTTNIRSTHYFRYYVEADDDD